MTSYSCIDMLRAGLVNEHVICTRRQDLTVCHIHRCHAAASTVLDPLADILSVLSRMLIINRL